MGFTAWDEPSMSTGVVSVDAQHRLLIDMLNQFILSAANGEGKQKLGEMLEFLRAYAIKHFSHEEKIMDEHRCPAAQRNKIAHASFLREFTALAAKVQRDGPSLGMVLDVQHKVLARISQMAVDYTYNELSFDRTNTAFFRH
jgi:hemerythrin